MNRVSKNKHSREYTKFKDEELRTYSDRFDRFTIKNNERYRFFSFNSFRHFDLLNFYIQS